MSSSIKEKYLFRRLQKKKRDAFIEFYDDYFDKIYRYIYFKVGNKEEAEDLTSQLFLKLWNLVCEGGITDHKTFRSFIYTVARNMIIDHYRKASQNRSFSIESKIEELNSINEESKGVCADIPDSGNDLEIQLDNKLSLEKIKEELFNLKDEYREIIILRYIEGLETDEIAEILKKTKGTIRVLAHRALKSLKEIVEKK
jgi:RNA polymerase sigma-70 factor, ECF subfamily